MKRISCLLALATALASAPAHATGGLVCETAGPRPIEIVLGFGHVPSPSPFLARLTDNGKEVPVDATQFWMRESELRLALVSRDALEEEAVLSAQWNESTHSFDGSLWRSGTKRWVRCREG